MSREVGRRRAHAHDPEPAQGGAPGKRTLSEDVPAHAGPHPAARHHNGRMADGLGAAEDETMASLKSQVAYETFLEAISYYTYKGYLGPGAHGPSRVAIDDPTLDALAEEVRGVVFILENDGLKDRTASALDLWGRVRGQVHDVFAQAPQQQADSDKVTEATSAVGHLEEVLLGARARDAVAAHQGTIDVGSPEAGYLKAAGKQVDEALMKGGELLAKAKDVAQASFGENAKLETGASGFELVYGLAVEVPELGERLEKAKEKGALATGATVFDLLKLSMNALNKLISLTGSLFSVALKSKGAEEVAGLFERAAEAAEHNPISSVTRVLGGAANALGIISSTLSLIDAVKSGDTRGALAAGHGIMQGAVGLGSTILRASAFEAGAASMGVFLFYEGVDILGTLGGILEGLRAEANLEKVGHFVRIATRCAQLGQAMAQTADTASNPGKLSDSRGIQDSLVTQIELMAEAQARQVVGFFPKLAGILYDWDRNEEFKDVAQALGPTARRVVDAGVPDLEPISLAFNCRDLFHGIDRMGRYAVAKFGDDRHSDDAEDERDEIRGEVADENAAR
jgi:hypothetical protein